MCDRCKCKGLLQRKGIGITELRRYVIKVLTLAEKSLTPSEILKEIRKIHRINKVTLYRILALLEEKEIVRSILTSDGISRYALIDPLDNGNQNLSPHFICRKCKTIIPINSGDMCSLIEKRIQGKFNGPFELTIEGICSKCRKEEND
jgi:Fur family ferric uptake transcriptional regulator